MADDNMKALEQGMEKARELAAKMLFEKGMPLAAEVVDEAYSYKSWKGFTGNAQTSYGTSMTTFDGYYGQYDSNSGARPVIRSKVELDEIAYLENPYEGEAREVKGKADIEWPYSDDAVDHFLNGSRPKPHELARTRFAFPVEYKDYLQNSRSGGHRDEDPLEIMHQLAMLALKGIK